VNYGRVACILVVLLSSPGRVVGQTSCFYVAPNGSDVWSGRRAAPDAERTDGPFATPQRARGAVRELKRRQGDVLGQPVTVLLRGGIYHLAEPLRLSVEDAGTELRPVTYAAYGGEKPVISGGRPIRGWWPVELDGKTVWAADLPEVRFGNDLSLADWQAKGMDPHARIADPLFIAPEKDDFRLRPGSPALALGFQSFSLEGIGPRLPPEQP
jgi:hypothetical protein